MSARVDRRGALLVVGVLAAVLAVGLVIASRTGGHSAPARKERLVGLPAPRPLSAFPHAPDPAAAGAARTFLSGYLAYLYGQADTSQIRQASPQLIATLPLKRLTVNPAALHLHPAVVALGAREPGGSVLHVAALISDGVSRYPIQFVMVHEQRGWDATQLANPE